MVDGEPFGRYRLGRIIGEGGMGRVYEAFDTATERTVALKVLPEALAGNREFRERFRRKPMPRPGSANRISCRSTTTARSTDGCSSRCA